MATVLSPSAVSTATQAVLGQVNPTFILRGVDCNQVHTDYLQGVYEQLSIPQAKVSRSATTVPIAHNHGSSANDETYTYRDKSNILQTIVTTNHQYWTITNKGVDTPPLRCNWCYQPIPDGQAIPIPTFMVTAADTGALTFYGDGAHCRFECCLSSLRRATPYSSRHRDPLYAESEQLLRLIYSRLHGSTKGPLREAPDWRLLRANGGPEDERDFYANTSRYVRTNNIVVLPMKVEYVKS